MLRKNILVTTKAPIELNEQVLLNSYTLEENVINDNSVHLCSLHPDVYRYIFPIIISLFRFNTFGKSIYD